MESRMTLANNNNRITFGHYITSNVFSSFRYRRKCQILDRASRKWTRRTINRGHILIVEDSRSYRSKLRDYLSQDNRYNYTIIETETGAEGLRQIPNRQARCHFARLCLARHEWVGVFARLAAADRETRSASGIAHRVRKREFGKSSDRIWCPTVSQ